MKPHSLVFGFALASILAFGTSTRGEDGPPPPRPEGPRRMEEPRTGGDLRDAERNEIMRHLEKSRMELKELMAHGHEDEAREMEARIGKLKRRLNELNRPPGEGPRREQAVPKAPRPQRPGRNDREMPTAERIEHVKIAITHLHAAGLHDVAERLTRELEEKQRRMREEGLRDGGRGPDRPDLQRQLDDLRRQLEELRHRLDQGRPGEPGGR